MIKKSALRQLAALKVEEQFKRQLQRITSAGQETDKIKLAVDEVMERLSKTGDKSIVVYGDPQSGKTEMMICLTAKLMDSDHRTVIHLLNDSVDLLNQSIDRFRRAGLAPAPKIAGNLPKKGIESSDSLILFCKKNASDLSKLVKKLAGRQQVVIVDDEADYATPNSKINANVSTKINKLITSILGVDGKYIGVTATPARLNLNNTFNNRTEAWVRFRPHSSYTGHETFFPQSGPKKFRLYHPIGSKPASDAVEALIRFCITVAYLNVTAASKNLEESNYSLLIHTSGRTADHERDRAIMEGVISVLSRRTGATFEKHVSLLQAAAVSLYPNIDPTHLISYVVRNISRSSVIVLNSTSESAGGRSTDPTCPFTVIVGGNIVSRGVTFPNLLSMFFTRDVKTKLQQDTYIQRARMFGARGPYLEHFELTIPEALYADWNRCFGFHQLALRTSENNREPPLWISDSRIAITSPSSIDRATVDFKKGEMSFQMFDLPDPDSMDKIILKTPTSIRTLKEMRKICGDGLPAHLIKFIEESLRQAPRALAIHTCSSPYGSDADRKSISRKKGFIGATQLERAKFPDAVHHVKIFYNEDLKARVFYKRSDGSLQFTRNEGGKRVR